MKNQPKFRTPSQVIDLWVKALYSGKYRQGKGALRPSKGTFCCLGVLCDLAAKDGGQQWTNDFNYSYSYKHSFPPEHLTNYLGLTHIQILFLAETNDKGESFNNIATHIERFKPQLAKNLATRKV